MKYFLDTSFVIALFVKKDVNHSKAKDIFKKIRVSEIWLHDGIILEIGNFFSSAKSKAIVFIEKMQESEEVKIVPLDENLLRDSFELYKSRIDKTWGLVDCISFIVMENYKLTDVLTADVHFEQAGFIALLK